MKKTEFAKLLGDLPENYILEAQAHRSGRRPGRERGLVLKFAAAAAAAAVMIGGFFWALEYKTVDRQAASVQEETQWCPMPNDGPLSVSNRAAYKQLGTSHSSGGSRTVTGELTKENGYSLYVPIEGWTYEKTSVGQYEADSWYYDKDPQTRLTVIPSDSEVMTWQKPGYVFQRATRYSLTMYKKENSETQRILQVKLRLGETTNYVIQVEYSDDFPDRNVLGSMEDSIQFSNSVALNRQAESEFPYEICEGQKAETHLAVEDGYSLYILDSMNNVQMDAVAETVSGREARSWYGESGESLSVVNLGEISQTDAARWMKNSQEWTSTEETDGNIRIRGTCADVQVEITLLRRADSWYYAVIKRCPKDSIENLWRVLDSMAGSIQFS